MQHQLEVMLEKPRHLVDSVQMSTGIACTKTSTTMFLHAPYVNSQNTNRKIHLDWCNLFLLLQQSERTFL